MIARCTLGLVLAMVVAPIHAGAPKQTAAFGIALESTPQSVAALLAATYKPCGPVRSVYRHNPGAGGPAIAALGINPGLTAGDPVFQQPCSYSPAGDDLIDAIDARFAHPDVDGKQGLYWLEAYRGYPDAVHARPPRLRMSFDELRSELFRTYGKPIDERRERYTSAAANLATSLGIDKNVKREDYRVRYLWAADGRLADAAHDDSPCECTGPYVRAVIEISRSPSTLPKNKFYVLSVTLLVEDPELRRRQATWDAQGHLQKR
jgi:hypothetical protein